MNKSSLDRLKKEKADWRFSLNRLKKTRANEKNKSNVIILMFNEPPPSSIDPRRLIILPSFRRSTFSFLYKSISQSVSQSGTNQIFLYAFYSNTIHP
ncbi:hypothetical protein QVD17_00141 [Tagetes erecta]|uniref:Uncharacterized protein n=1 Tax=Tagetes erecta TaxID=13708 RepID=A0AAD8P747_TARER|nr:hypothetical protein QVD17_00141 [Tagetes erecta]